MTERAYAFFFNANHSTLSSLYGPPCTSQVLTAISSSSLTVNTQILRGDLLPHMLAYRISAVSTKELATGRSRSVGRQMAHDKDLYKLILCDLADSFDTDWHSLDLQSFPFEMAQNPVWTIVLPSISNELALFIDKSVRDFPSYLGATAIDTGNPLHIRLFTLVNGAFINNKGFFYRIDEENDLDEGGYTSNSYGAASKPVLLKPEEFDHRAPIGLEASRLSERGSVSQLRLRGKSVPTHREKVAHALITYLYEHQEIKEFSYQADLVSEGDSFVCDQVKIQDYLLNVDHPAGGPKARFFINSLGIQREDWKYLADQISGAMNTAVIYRLKSSEHGISHGAFIEIVGRNNRKAILETGWIISGNSSPRLVTAYPRSEPVEGELEAPPQSISPLGLIGAERWADIYQRAHLAGDAAANRCVPTPMTLEGYAPIFAGKCGFAWINIPDVRRGMAKWCKDNGIGSKNYKSGWDIWADPTPDSDNSRDSQSIEPKQAYADAFAKVLIDNGVPCRAESRLD